MKKVIAVFDIGKTNKKILLFDSNFHVVFENSIRFEEILDDDGFPCDDIDAIERWIKNQVKAIQKNKVYKLVAINFSTHGATVMYLDKTGNKITPLYNYLKPLDDFDFSGFYSKYGGVKEFSRKTASPAYGMLNSGLQMYWLKNAKPHFWKQVHSILHYPQYLSYLFSNKITADFTSIGSHTAIWDFDLMKYHYWLGEEGITLPIPVNGKEAVMVNLNGENVAIGSGLHDSSSSLIPVLEENENEEFILLSTGTWIISMNPFSKEQLTQSQLAHNCLCYITTDKKQVKSSMQFLGHVHEINVMELNNYFGKENDYFIHMDVNKNSCNQTFRNSKRIFFPSGLPDDYKADMSTLSSFENFEEAYSQLVFEISQMVYEGLGFILDKKNKLKTIYISGGFNKNIFFMQYLSLMMPDLNIEVSQMKNTSALGAALLMKKYFS